MGVRVACSVDPAGVVRVHVVSRAGRGVGEQPVAERCGPVDRARAMAALTHQATGSDG